MILPSAIDHPPADSLNDPLALRIEGWLHAGARHSQIEAIEIHSGGRMIGQTAILVSRPDVNRALQLAPDTLTGFALLISAPQLFVLGSASLECRARFRDGTGAPGTIRNIKLIAHDHRDNHYGVLVRPEETRLFHRGDIYTSGPSVSEFNPDCLALIQRYTHPREGRILDVGCGFGSYGRPLREAGYDWFGVEVKASDCTELARLGLPHQQVDGSTLPFESNAFATTMCIEVLEHIADPKPFLAEIRRVTARRLLISVPNLELIPYLHRYAVVPWHLLEGDHKNFFTRVSLRQLLGAYFRNVEILSYAPIPVQTPEGLPLHNHLFAVCEV